MKHMPSKEAIGLRQDRLLTTLDRLLELPTTDVNSTINRGLQRADVVRWDDCCKRLAAEHELTRAEPQHDQYVRRARGPNQRAVIDVLQVSALRARHDRAGLCLA